MRFTRRRFLASSAGALLASAAAGRPVWGADADAPFAHGVASGDPLADRVVLWTRVTPRAGGSLDPVRVDWRIARDPALAQVVAGGAEDARVERDFTVKVDVTGLEPGTTYYYRFDARGEASPRGRTRTLPVGAVDRLRLAVCSCANYPQGFYDAYAHVARRADLDAVLHLGDYLYEYANGTYGDGRLLGRVPVPDRECVTLADYRERHALYKTDPDLQEVHRQHPMIAVWDDHELANDAWLGGAENHDPATEGPWPARRRAAVRAYHEWMPIRELPAGAGFADRGQLFRSFRFGDLAHLSMLDARLYGRDQQVARGDFAEAAARDLSLLGASQRAWLLEELARARRGAVAWRLIGQQIVFAPLARPGETGNPDAWDGYPTRRDELFDLIEQQGVDDVVVLSGDIHSSWANDVPRSPFDPAAYDPATGRGSLAVEAVAPAVSSSPLGSFPEAVRSFERVTETHPHVRYQEMDHRGYILLDVDRERTQAEWWHMETVERRGGGEHLGAALRTVRGASHWVRAERASEPRGGAPEPA